jgi:hypothetical protein
VVSLNFDENESARFFKLLKTDPVIGEEPRFPERNDFRVGARSVEREMLRLDWHDHRILKRMVKLFSFRQNLFCEWDVRLKLFQQLFGIMFGSSLELCSTVFEYLENKKVFKGAEIINSRK